MVAAASSSCLGITPNRSNSSQGLAESFGFAPIYLGGLAVGGRLQQAGGPLAGRDLVDFGNH
jgi:8-hydroxy-5-deazaflavin:NADPH oxidoreductase